MLLPLLLCCLLLWSLSLAVASLVFVWSLVSLVLRLFYDVRVVATGVVATGAAIGIATGIATGVAIGVAIGVAAGAVATGVAIGVVVTAVVDTAVITGIVAGVVVITGIFAGVVTTGVAADSLVFLGLLSLLYARSLLYLW